MKLKTKVQLVGIVVVVIGFIIAFYDDSRRHDLATHQQYFIISIGLIIVGMGMILQKKLLKGIKNTFEEKCNCCKCTNCDRNHNHWIHD